MNQPPLFDLPFPVEAPSDRPQTQRHVEVRVYPPTPERSSWFVISTSRGPGFSDLRSYEVGAAYTPAYVGRTVGELLNDAFLDLEPF